jgi:hypothetical protein
MATPAVEHTVYLDAALSRRLAQRATDDHLTVQDELRAAVSGLLGPHELLHPAAQGAGEWPADACDFALGLPTASDLL